MNDLQLRPHSKYRSTCYELNSSLYDFMSALNFQDNSWSSILKLSSANTEILDKNYKLKQWQLNTPILCVVPLFNTKEEWLSLISGEGTRLKESFIDAPQSINSRTAVEINYMNKFYLQHVFAACNSSPLAALELGIPFEIIGIIKELTVTQKNNIYQFKLPLFKWRHADWNNELDQTDYCENDWLLYLVKNSPHGLSDLDSTSKISARYSSEQAYPYAEQLVLFNMRATIIKQLIPNIHSAKIRDMYKRIKDDSSSCGKLPTSHSWYFASEKRRLHSTFFLLLYRMAYKAGLAHLPSVIAAYAWYLQFSKDEPMPIDRAGIFVNVAQSGSGLIYSAKCKKCEGDFILSNLPDNREFAHNFHCHSCSKKHLIAA